MGTIKEGCLLNSCNTQCQKITISCPTPHTLSVRMYKDYFLSSNLYRLGCQTTSFSKCHIGRDVILYGYHTPCLLLSYPHPPPHPSISLPSYV